MLPPGMDRGDSLLDRRTAECTDVIGWYEHLRLVVEDHQTEAVPVIESIDQTQERLLGIVQPISRHRT